MIQFIRNSLLALLLFGCIKKKSVQLPFFNKPDFTPEWIEPKTNAYQAIHTIPPFSLVDQHGEAITEKILMGKIYVANFMFTSCISICPLMTDNMKLLQVHFINDPEVLLLSHSVMPDIDSVARLRKFAEQKGIIATKWHVLTGNREAIYTLAKRHYFAGDSIGFYGNQNDFLHTENFILIDKHRRIRGVYNGTLKFEMDRIIEDIDLLKGEE